MVKDDNVMVSVCCLAYNHEKYIRHTLEGFVNQRTNFKYEVIVHDDASTDKTKSIIEEFCREYPNIIKPIFQVENQYATKGIVTIDECMYSKVNGKYVCYCEGDDYWCDDDKLQKQFDVLEDHPECSICVHKVQCINEDDSDNGGVIPEGQYQIKEGIVDEEMICKAFWIREGYPFHTSSYFVRRGVVERLLRDRIPTFSYFNGDMNILRVSFCEGKFYYIDRVMSKRRLLSIGSWNSRQRLLPREEKVVYAKKQLQGELAFSGYTHHKYANYVKIAIAKNVLWWGKYDIRRAQEVVKCYGIRCDVFDGTDVDQKVMLKVNLICLMYFPFLLRIIRWLRERKNGNEL